MFVLIPLFSLGFGLNLVWSLEKFFLFLSLIPRRVVSYVLCGPILRFNKNSIASVSTYTLASIFVAQVYFLKRCLFDFALPLLFLSFDHLCHVFLHLLVHLVRTAND